MHLSRQESTFDTKRQRPIYKVVKTIKAPKNTYDLNTHHTQNVTEALNVKYIFQAIEEYG